MLQASLYTRFNIFPIGRERTHFVQGSREHVIRVESFPDSEKGSLPVQRRQSEGFQSVADVENHSRGKTELLPYLVNVHRILAQTARVHAQHVEPGTLTVTGRKRLGQFEIIAQHKNVRVTLAADRMWPSQPLGFLIRRRQDPRVNVQGTGRAGKRPRCDRPSKEGTSPQASARQTTSGTARAAASGPLSGLGGK